jgi:hypothetical protein
LWHVVIDQETNVFALGVSYQPNQQFILPQVHSLNFLDAHMTQDLFQLTYPLDDD